MKSTIICGTISTTVSSVMGAALVMGIWPLAIVALGIEAVFLLGLYIRYKTV